MRALLMFGLVVAASAGAAVPGEVNHQGRIIDASGAAASAPAALTFALYDVASDGVAVWTEVHPSVAVADGYYAVQLGSITPFPANVFASGPRWLGVTVGAGDEMAPRTQILPVPVASAALGVEVSSTPPVACDDPSHRGRMYFDTDDDAFLGCDGTAWGGLGGSGPVLSARYGSGDDGAVSISGSLNVSTAGATAARIALGKPEAEAFAVSLVGTETVIVTGTGTGGTASAAVNSSYLVGDELLIIEMQGSSGTTGTVGTYAPCVVESVAGATITCTANLGVTFGAGNLVQVVRVPNYTTFTLASSGTITWAAWDGAKGGVFAFKARDVASIDGLIDGAGRGFRGGAVGPGAAEGSAGRVATGGAGGGGGSGHGDSASFLGAGGAPGGASAVAANGGAGSSFGGRQAGGGGGRDTGVGGANGGSSGVGNNNSAPPPGTAGTGGGAAAGYDAGAGGGGAIPLAAANFAAPADLSRLQLGGGAAHGGGGGGGGSTDGGPGGQGGSGGNANGTGGAGGVVGCTAGTGASGALGAAGGGIVWISAETLSIASAAVVRASGGTGGNGGTGGAACFVGGGGGGSGGGGGWGGDGGAGGAILLQADTVALGTNRVQAAGGNGGAGGSGGGGACSGRCGAAGGSGGSGLTGVSGAIRVEYVVSASGSTSAPNATVVQVTP